PAPVARTVRRRHSQRLRRDPAAGCRSPRTDASPSPSFLRTVRPSPRRPRRPGGQEGKKRHTDRRPLIISQRPAEALTSHEELRGGNVLEEAPLQLAAGQEHVPAAAGAAKADIGTDPDDLPVIRTARMALF